MSDHRERAQGHVRALAEVLETHAEQLRKLVHEEAVPSWDEEGALSPIERTHLEDLVRSVFAARLAIDRLRAGYDPTADPESDQFIPF